MPCGWRWGGGGCEVRTVAVTCRDERTTITSTAVQPPFGVTTRDPVISSEPKNVKMNGLSIVTLFAYATTARGLPCAGNDRSRPRD